MNQTFLKYDRRPNPIRHPADRLRTNRIRPEIQEVRPRNEAQKLTIDKPF